MKEMKIFCTRSKKITFFFNRKEKEKEREIIAWFIIKKKLFLFSISFHLFALKES